MFISKTMSKLGIAVMAALVLFICGCSISDNSAVSVSFSNDYEKEVKDVFGDLVTIALPEEYGVDPGDMEAGGYYIRISEGGLTAVVASDYDGANAAAARLLAQFKDKEGLISAANTEILAASPDGGLYVPSVISSHMVIQRGEEICVYGKSSPCATVFGTFRGIGYTESSFAVSDENGEFYLSFPEMEADASGKNLYISDSSGNFLSYDDILSGDVWVITGQSNSARELYRSMEYYGETVYPLNESSPVRLLYQSPVCKTEAANIDGPQEDVLGGEGWSVCSKDSIGRFSAIGAYFAEEYLNGSDVPVGLIQAAANGAALSELMPKETAAELGMTGINVPAGNYFDLLISPLKNTKICGVLVYQGESEAGISGYYTKYAEEFCRFVGELRSFFGSFELPILQVQLTTHGVTGAQLWPDLRKIRQAQLKAAETMSNMYLISSIDCGAGRNEEDMAHPLNKRPIGQRAAQVALQYILGIAGEEESQPPYPIRATVEKSKIVIEFAKAGSGIFTTNGKDPAGFVILYSDGPGEKPLSAKISGKNTVVLEYNTEKTPTSVIYGDLVYTNDDTLNLCNSMTHAAAFIVDLK